MNMIRVLTLAGSAALLFSCETTDISGGNQEAKRRAEIERQKHQQPVDESQANLWDAQNDRLNRDSNPLRAY